LTTKRKRSRDTGVFNRLHAKHRLLISGGIALVVYFSMLRSDISSITQIMIGLDVFAIVLVTMSWINFFTTPQHELRNQAKEQDGSRILVFVIILLAAAASLLGVVLLLVSEEKQETARWIKIIAAVAGMFFSWMLVHTTFAYRYAHLYYANHESKANQDVEGLEFPDDNKPDFLDFAYFSFVLGMTFQVSDVEISEKKIRRLALLHGLISFLYNTTLIAMTINILASSGNK
jgi:uncharacterized membrane protein